MSKQEDFWVIRAGNKEYRVTEAVARAALAWYREVEHTRVTDYFEFQDLYDSYIAFTVNSFDGVYETTATQRDEEREHIKMLGDEDKTYD